MKLLRFFLFWLVVLAASLAGILVGIDNQQDTLLRFYQWQSPSLPLYLWLFIFLFLGILLGYLISAWPMLRMKLKLRKLEKTKKS